ncbi:glycosyltransferase [Patescibacteria group bacterium]|nr:glycosyltransferase [Patescibacteria group bacterium]
MRVLIVSSAYTPTVNGIVTHIQSLKNDLESMGHEVWVLAPGRKGFTEVEKHIVRLKSVHNPLNSDYPLAFGFFFPKMLRNIKFDIIHLHHPFGVTAVSLWAKSNSKAKLVFTNHTQYETYTEYYAPTISKPLKKIIRHLLKGLYKRCDTIICSTKDIEKYVRGIYGGSKIKIIPVGFNDQALTPSLEKGATRGMHDIERDDFYILYTGRIAEEKNLDFLISAVKQAHSKNNKIKLVIAGGGDYLKKLAAESCEYIHFTGSLPPKELASHYQDCDLFASASVTETLGLVFAEAAYLGAPLLGIDSDGVRDVIKSGQNGILAKDEADFLDKLVKLSIGEIKLDELKKNSKQSSLYFSASKNSKKIETLYKNILS